MKRETMLEKREAAWEQLCADRCDAGILGQLRPKVAFEAGFNAAYDLLVPERSDAPPDKAGEWWMRFWNGIKNDWSKSRVLNLVEIDGVISMHYMGKRVPCAGWGERSQWAPCLMPRERGE